MTYPATLLIVFSALVLQAMPAPPPTSAQIDFSMQSGIVVLHDENANEKWACAVSYDVTDRTVSFLWDYAALQGGMATATARETQVFSLSYYPTVVCALTNDRILVGGLEPRSGNSIIEVWSFRRPLKFVVMGGDVQLAPQSLQAKARVHDAQTAGMLIPNAASRLGSQDVAIVRFSDRNEVYSFQLSGGSASLVATDMNYVFNSNRPMVSPSLGDVAVFGSHTSVPHVLFSDLDGDGVVDAVDFAFTDLELDTLLQ